MASLTESATGLGSQLGKYFSVASLLPALLFVLWVVGLIGLGLPGEPVDAHKLAVALTTWSATKVGGVLVASLILGLTVHPLLFSTTQALEGYWGSHPLAVRMALQRAGVHRSRLHDLIETTRQHTEALNASADNILVTRRGWSREDFENAEAEGTLELSRRSVLGAKDGLPLFGRYFSQQVGIKSQSVYPTEGHRVMPTRLGNALRRAEDQVGSQYGLDAITIAPHITVAAAPQRVAYIDDSRQEMDLAIRLCFFGLLASVLTTVWLVPSGWWLLLAAIPYAFAYITYRGAVAAAREWGTALRACVDLDRFALYDALHIRLPKDTNEERDRNVALIELLQGDPSAVLDYEHPSRDA